MLHCAHKEKNVIINTFHTNCALSYSSFQYCNIILQDLTDVHVMVSSDASKENIEWE